MILEVLEGKAYKYEKLSLADQVVLFYHKCKTNLTNGCLAIEFNVTEDKVSAVFEHIEFALFDHAQRLNRKGLPDKRSAVGFCLGSGLFGSYNSL